MSCRNILSALVLLACLAFGNTFQPLPTSLHATSAKSITTHSQPLPNIRSSHRGCDNLFGGFLDDIGGFFKRFTQKATASHILIKGGAEAANKLEDLKVQIDNSPTQFAQVAAEYSECPSARQGGSLGEFGPGQMVKEFDQVVFNEPVGVVHGPVKTQFGYHLIYISDRSD